MKKLTLVSLLLVAFLSDNVTGNFYGCPKGLTRNKFLKVFRNKCYRFVDREVEWGQALTDCHRHGGTLVHIKDGQTQKFIMSSLRSLIWKYDGVWIGARDYAKNNRYTWSDSSDRVSYENWDTGEPSCYSSSKCYELCGQLRLDEKGRWHDYRCWWDYTYICMYDFIHTTTTSTTTTTTTTSTTTTTKTPTTKRTTPTTTVTTTATTKTHPNIHTTSSTVAPPILAFRRPTTTRRKSTTTPPLANPPANSAIRLQAKDANTTSNKDMIIGVVMGVLGTIIIIIVILVALLFVRRRRKRSVEEATGFANPVYGPTNRAPTVVYRRDERVTISHENIANQHQEDSECLRQPPHVRPDYLHAKNVELPDDSSSTDGLKENGINGYAECPEYDDDPEKIYQEIDDFQEKPANKGKLDDSDEENYDETDDVNNDNEYVDMDSVTKKMENK